MYVYFMNIYEMYMHIYMLILVIHLFLHTFFFLRYTDKGRKIGYGIRLYDILLDNLKKTDTTLIFLSPHANSSK